MDQQLRRGFQVGEFEVEPLTGSIKGPTGAQRVQPRVMDVLVFLARHAGELVERDTLLEQVWRRVTTEEVLTRCISELRSVFADERGSPSYIQTIPKRGYRLMQPVVPRADAASAPAASTPAVSAMAEARTPPAPAAAVASVAVLPFESHSADPAHQFLGDAFAAELHGALARVHRLRVAARRSSFAFKESSADLAEIGAKLSVDHVITGSVQLAGDALRVVAELSDAKSGTQIWAQTYDRPNSDLLAIEKELAGAIVASFTTVRERAEIASARHGSTSSLDAWGLVQKARSFVLDYTPAAFEAAAEPLKRAIELDAAYPAARAALASLWVERLVNASSTNPAKDEAEALEAAETALELAPQDPFILKMVALVFAYAGDQRRALACLRDAVAYTPFDYGAWGYFGWPLTATGDPRDLTDLHDILDRLLAMEPQHPGISFWLYHKSVAHACSGDYAKALDAAERAVALRPSFALGWMHCANLLGHERDVEAARKALERCAAINSALTAQHFAALMGKMSRGHAAVLEHRVGGLVAFGALPS